MSDSYDDYEAKIQLAEHEWEKRVVKTEHDRAVELVKAYERGWNAALAQQEPVAWRTFDGEGGYDYRSYEMNETYDKEWAERNPNHKGWVEPLYTAPPISDYHEGWEEGFKAAKRANWFHITDEQLIEKVRRRGFVIRDSQIDVPKREWVGLTAYEIQEIYLKDLHWGNFACAIEAKLKEKNGG